MLHGKELSYNNILDLDSALNLVREFAGPTVVVLKHNNPCGAATAELLVDAFTRAWAGDPQSDCAITGDGLTLFFATNTGGDLDVDYATRAAIGATWVPQGAVANVSSGRRTRRPASLSPSNACGLVTS